MFEQMIRLLCRFRHPVSLPEEVAQALGISLSNFLSPKDCIERIGSPSCCPTRLRKFMKREHAEAAFALARRKDRFLKSSLFSYYFNDAWLEFKLDFDDESRLRRIYVFHKDLHQGEGVELKLLETPANAGLAAVAGRDTVSCYVAQAHRA